MSRVAKAPIAIPAGVEVTLNGQEVTIKGAKGSLSRVVNEAVEVVKEDNVIRTIPREGVANATAQAGTARALLQNMVVGVAQGYERKLQLVGVGYRANTAGSKLNLSLGFSHPIEFDIPQGITIEVPAQTEVVVKGVDKQLVGQVAANIRAYRKPEPYKGKGVRYADEQVRRKEAKKK
ncbi:MULTISPECIES: 50S ribosomal protein L6 [Pseudidiomarina]|jgi:large subunit ribosomal protein L6|uniref:Large ribosomal subunit protein uL6 n=2 Tax=Pseudidiomarina TaxID=2800384 RepID=A0A0K6HCC9_9GAMM|nr:MULTISPECIES: 50S ribosomal protein L6 [Pseudidiomarina]MBR9908681.1 50S ribosomal protein L6 [Gammaproteobacteria bacterium]RUO46026.1 50S ribosomal protein L6 [Pseudidiomarina donghaiensis]CUA88436.1 ribosomal protein L6, bacterial type [Pseudidiomarina woesei]SFV25051.1 large subunit ribosomal protein L6 [Pseudidiomarina donghaiensis]